jgi:hypothetical protein
VAGRSAALHRRPGTWLAVFVCLSFPWIWNAWLPEHVGDPITVVLNPPRPADALTLPAEHERARRLERDPGEKGGRPRSATWELTVEQPGSYSLFGLSSHEESRPLELWIDEAKVSAMAFFHNTGSLRGDFERHRIATGLPLGAGTHTLKLAGNHLFRRTLVVELQREAPLRALRFAALAVLAALLLGLRAALVARISLAPGARLAISLAFALALPGLPLALLAASSGRAFAAIDHREFDKRGRLSALETYLASDEHRKRGDRYSVALLGDSTHFWPLEPHQHMLPSVERALPAAERERVELYGISAAAFGAYDYYHLTNRLVVERPDLIVVPVNLRALSSWWAQLHYHDFRPIERYLRANELLHVHGIAVGPREIDWAGWLLVRADAWLGGRIAPFLRGVGRYARTEAASTAEALGPAWLARPAPEAARARLAPASSPWPSQISADDPNLRLLRRIGSLAERHGVRVLFYTVQTNTKALARTGVRLGLARRFAEIEALIAPSPNVSFLQLAGDDPEWMFADEGDHLSPRGVEAVAGNLAAAILRLRDAGGI